MSDYLDPNNEELLKDYFSEAQQQIELLEQNILVLENDPQNKEAIDEIFRAAHTLKGASATVQMNELSEFTHIMEDVLDEIRSSNVTVNKDVVDILLSSIDVIKLMIESRAGGDIYSDDITDIKNTLKLILNKNEGPPPISGSTAINETVDYRGGVKTDSMEGLSEYELLELQQEAEPGSQLYRITVLFNENNPMNTVGGIQVYAAIKQLGEVLKSQPDLDSLYEDVFYPSVDYILSSVEPEGEILSRISIPDVTTDIKIQIVDTSKEPDADQPPVEEEEQLVQSEDKSDTLGEPAAAVAAKPEATGTKLNKSKPHAKKPSGSVLRVDSGRIDNLLNLVSEAVINKATFNQMSLRFVDSTSELQGINSKFKEQLKNLFDSLPEYLDQISNGASPREVKQNIVEQFGDIGSQYEPFENLLKSSISRIKGIGQNLGRITGELQEGVMKIRMVPVSQIFSRFPRLVRDLSKSLKKQIHLEIEGEDTELDKSVIEYLLDPLIHCVRNSIDHGIESPADREATGKPIEGHVNLRASNEGNMIIIEISDDGKGIDIESVKKKAVDKGLIHPGKTMTDIEAFSLIFEAGFSTAKNVTNISGRGVGLDVVRKQIEKLNGKVSVWSEKGEGTTMTIKLPLTLAIIQGLLVRVGKEIYAIPITSVIESHRIRPEEIRLIDNHEVFNVRDDVVSLLRLHNLFKIPESKSAEFRYVVLVGSGDKKIGLMVDSLIGEEDVVIKPLRDKYTNSPGIAGATILGDGTVSLIIDVSQLLDLSLKKEREERQHRELLVHQY
jgi:two-component system, chemotaxis family, sensor kinase CheA